jgi:hypothetical protein
LSRAVGLLSVLLAAAALALPAARAAEPAAVAVVLDRSASLRFADPDGQGPRLLALALALGLRPGQQVTVLTTGEGSERGGAGPFALDAGGDDPVALVRRLDALLAAPPAARGGADLADVLARARAAAGPRGVVIVYTDDDLDVVGRDGRPPAAALERARAAVAHPARDDVNRAAADLLVDGLRAGEGEGPALVGLRAALPARTVPVLERLGAAVIELRAAPGEVVARLVAALAGDPLALRGEPLDRGLTLPWAARAGVLLAAPGEVPGGRRVDGAGRLWVLDAPAGAALPALPGAIVVLAPRVDPPPDGLSAWALADGVVRVSAREAAAPPGCGLAARLVGAGRADAVALTAAPGAAGVWHGDLAPPTGATPAEVEVLRVVTREGSRAVAARRRVPVQAALVVLATRGTPRAGDALELAGPLPAGLVPRRAMALRVREASGGEQAVPLEVRGDALVARVVPREAGPLTVEAEGELPIRLAAPITVGPAARRELVVEGLRWARRGAAADLAAGDAVDARAPVRLELVVRLDPPAPEPVALAAALEGAPEGAALEAGAGVTITDRATLPLELRWPKAAPGGVVTLRARAGDASAGRVLVVDTGPSWTRRLVALGIIGGSLVWFVVLLRRRRRLIEQAVVTHGERQLRALGANGRLTFERYKLFDHSNDDLSVRIHPEDSQASLQLEVQPDGTVKARALDGARIVHADRPTLLAEEARLRHGDAFALVQDQRARRYVYLDREPSAEDLAQRYLDVVSIGEGEVRDSGVYVVLDDDQNLASTETVPATGALFSSRDDRVPVLDPGPDAPGSESDHDSDVAPDELIEDSSEEATVAIDDDDAARPLVSDEGVVIMDSTEERIIDSAEQERLPDDHPSASGGAP